MNGNKSYRSNYKKRAPPTSASSEYMSRVLGVKSVKSPTPAVLSKPLASKKRTLRPPPDVDGDDEITMAAVQKSLGSLDAKTPRKKKIKFEESEEKRLRRFRQKPPQSYLERLERVRTQRMFLIERNRKTSADGEHEEETFDIAGTTGNVYKVTVTKVPTCSCPDASKGNHCKHIVYVMVNVLKAPAPLAYQLALLSSELTTIFVSAPSTKKSDTDSPCISTDTGGTRKLIEGDCPVCVMPFEDGEELVWCRAACGQNIHRTCFEAWQRSKPGQVARCVYCRSVWKGEEKDIGKVVKKGVVNSEGYVNIAGELGFNTERDTSTYHPYWVSRQSGYHGGSSSWHGRGRRLGEHGDEH